MVLARRSLRRAATASTCAVGSISAPIDERAFYKVASTPGVARAERMLLGFGQFRLAAGGTQGVMQVAITAPQNQTRRKHDQSHHDHQQ